MSGDLYFWFAITLTSGVRADGQTLWSCAGKLGKVTSFYEKNWKTSYRFFFFIGLVPVPIEDIKVSHFSNEMFHIGPVLGSIKDSQSRGPDGKVQWGKLYSINYITSIKSRPYVFLQMSRAEAHLGVSPNAPSQDEPTLTLEQVIRMRKIFNQNCRANNGTKITDRLFW